MIADRNKFRTDLTKIVNCFPEWPSRPRKVSIFKEDAIFVVVTGNFCVPVFYDDPKMDDAKPFGYTKDEYEEAKRILKRENQWKN